ncbi:MAG: hypothetical protein WCG25_05020 [bacterium]
MIRYLRISSFTVNDFHAHEVASTTLFIFGNLELNLSKITSHHVCKFTQYNIHVSLTISFDINGKLHANEDVIALLTIHKSS